MASKKAKTEPWDRNVRVVVLGSEGVGKTSLVWRLTHPGEFPHHIEPGISDAYRVQVLGVNGEDVLLDILDLGYEGDVVNPSALDVLGSYDGTRAVYLTPSHVFAYSITDRSSLDFLDPVLEMVLRKSHRKETPLLVVGTKLDLEAERKVSQAEGEAWARKAGATYVEVSAKEGKGMEAFKNALLAVAVPANKEYAEERAKRMAKANKPGGCFVS